MATTMNVGAADFLTTPAKAKGSPEEGESFHTPATVKGMIPDSAPELRAMGNEALQEVRSRAAGPRAQAAPCR